MISVIMSVYNEKIDDLRKSIDSVLNQTFHDFEFVIICDNPNSTEIKEFLINKAKCYSAIKLIFNKKNIRQNLSRNKAIKEASSNCIVIMDADDIMNENRLKYQYKFFRDNNLDICFTNVSIINDEEEITRKNVFGDKNITNQKIMKKILFSHSIALGPTFMFKKDIFQSLGKYTDMNVEDYDLVSKFLVSGKRLGYIGCPLVFKRLRKNSISYNSLYEQYIIMKSISRYLKKYDGKKLIPNEYITKEVRKISNQQLLSYEKYASARYTFNDNKNVRNFFLVLFRIFFSKTVFFHLLWSIKNKVISKYYANK